MKNFVLLLTLFFVSTFSHAIPFRPNATEFELGQGASEVIKITADIGLGVSNPYIQLDNASGKWQFFNVGDAEASDLGSGSGSGGDGINVLTNEGIEDGVSDWTTSVISVSQVAYTNDLESNKNYAQTTASTASGEYIERTVTWPDMISGGCMAHLDYQNLGGMVLKIIDDAVEIAASDALESSTNWIKSPVLPFECPASGSVVNFRIESTGSGQLGNIDNLYLGSNKGFFPITSVDTLSAVFDNTGSATNLITSSADFIDSVARTGTGTSLITFKSGYFTVAPVVIGQAIQGTDVIVEASAISTNSVQIITQNHNSAVIQDADFNISVHKQGADTLQSNQAYTPEIADFLKGGEAFITNTANDWNIGTGSFTTGSTSSATMALGANSQPMQIACAGTEESSGFTCTGNENSGFSYNQKLAGATKVCAEFTVVSTGNSQRRFKLSETQNNSQTIVQDGKNIQYSDLENTSSTMQISMCEIFNFNETGKKTIRIFAQGSGSDSRLYAQNGLGSIRFSFEPIQHNVSRPIIQNMVDTSNSQKLTIDSCRINNNGTATTEGSQCSSWLSTVNRDSNGVVTITFSESYTEPPVCVCTTVNDGSDRKCEIDWASDIGLVGSIRVRTSAASSNSANDNDFSLICTGIK